MWLTEEQVALSETVAAVLARHSNVREAMVSGYDRALWRTLCEQIGVAGLAIPETYGGSGAGLPELQVVMEQLGRTLTPTPLLGTTIAAKAVLATENPESCRRLLPAIAAGQVATLAWTGPDGHWLPDQTACKATDSGLHGEAHYVLDGDTADILLVAADDQLFEVDSGQTGVLKTHKPTLDQTRRLATVTLDGARGRPLGPANLQAVLDFACSALAAEQVGTAARCLELTVEYTKCRMQFGRPIASFQAVKHRLADMHVLVETARSAALDTDHAAVARVYCTDALCRVAGEMVQLHGGIAITWEHDAQLYFKRAHGSAQLFGQPTEYLLRFADIPT